MVRVIAIAGKAKDVFSEIRLMAEKTGKMTIAELARLNELRRGK